MGAGGGRTMEKGGGGYLDKIRQWITDMIFYTETHMCVTQNQGPRFTYKHGKNKMNQSLQV